MHCMECRCDLAMRILSVRPSVHLSIKRVDCDKMKEKSVQIFIPYERSFSLVLREKEWLVGGDPVYMKFRVNWPPLERDRHFEQIIARSTPAITPSEKSSVNTNRKSTTHFPMSLGDHCTLPLSPPKGA